ncbi:hypothetical protein BVG19_g4069 [[Candida] boidinii]|nr:hypothetical protein BVG19_g4069 [[Candida] boidinii]OWB52956.1 hypothetical protein B5S27_g4541 [[Candida] boidinii]
MDPSKVEINEDSLSFNENINKNTKRNKFADDRNEKTNSGNEPTNSENIPNQKNTSNEKSENNNNNNNDSDSYEKWYKNIANAFSSSTSNSESRSIQEESKIRNKNVPHLEKNKLNHKNKDSYGDSVSVSSRVSPRKIFEEPHVMPNRDFFHSNHEPIEDSGHRESRLKDSGSDSESQPPSPKAENSETEHQLENYDKDNEKDSGTKLNRPSTFGHFRRSIFGKNDSIQHEPCEDKDIAAVSDSEQQNEQQIEQKVNKQQQKQQQDNNNNQQQNHERRPRVLPSKSTLSRRNFLKPFKASSSRQAVQDHHQKNSSSTKNHKHDLVKRSNIRKEMLITSLTAGAPVALLTSSIMTTDEHGVRRAPLLLQLLSLSMTDITTKPNTKKRKFRIDLQYGIDDYSLKWTLERSLRDITNLHNKLKVLFFQSATLRGKEVTLPKLPKYIRSNNRTSLARIRTGTHKSQQASKNSKSNDGTTDGKYHQENPANSPRESKHYGQSIASAYNRRSGLNDVANEDLIHSSQISDDEIPVAAECLEQNNNDQYSYGNDLERDYSESNRVDQFSPMLLHPNHNSSSASSIVSGGIQSIQSSVSVWKSKLFKKEKDRNSLALHDDESFRVAIQTYFDNLFAILVLRPQANRLFQFFELSPLGVLLTTENRKKCKEGYLLIKSTAKKQGWKVSHLRATDLRAMVERHTAKWFVIGHSYIMYVADIYSTTPLDVFLVDSDFTFTLTGISDDAPITDKNLNLNFPNIKSNDDDDDDDEDDDDDSFDEDEDIVEGLAPGKGYLSLTMENKERKLSVVGKSADKMIRWAVALSEMQRETIWSRKNRFGSFAPIRNDCFAQWFVDARDYWWSASTAIELAKDVIYIHDWWLSPELYLRRPANGNQNYRIDRLLKKKAEEGVKIFIIIYRNVANTVVTDSLWTKHSLLDLHENIYVLRSPNQLMQNVFFWAHHEKLLIVDHKVCFLGGIDLCYGRYDTPDHVLTDDYEQPFDSRVRVDDNKKGTGHQAYQIFPGKDYSNPRVKDFIDLDEPFKDMYDRSIVPRMPWHDVHMVTCGQVARDLSRHFVQRWNYLIRMKRPSRPTPLLIPPPPMTEEEIKKLGFKGSCEVQLLRSSCNWSLGLKETEQSIQNAYLKLIETSEHFVYIENQFFVTACKFDGVVIKNAIGDALVERIVRAHSQGKSWKATIVIPLMPGFEAEVDTKEGSSVRVIMQCQYMSISMGESSIFSKLRSVGITPQDYINFYSLRKWGYIGPEKLLVSEQLYIHAKTMIVDDRVAIIGSANINERSMRGNRDSEVAAIVRDREMVDTMMDEKPYKAGKFAHTLRMRLMREHLGVDVDLVELVEFRFLQIEKFARTKAGLKASTLNQRNKHIKKEDHYLSAMVELATRVILNDINGSKRFEKFMEGFESNVAKDSVRDGSALKASHDNQEAIGEEGELDSDKFLINEGLKRGKHLYKQLVKFCKEDCKISGGSLSASRLNENLSKVFSFNHRAGEENVGLRDKKQFSTDSRVTEASHRNEVRGFGADKYKTSGFINSRKNVTKILREWTNLAFSATGNDNYVPMIEDVEEFLIYDFTDKSTFFGFSQDDDETLEIISLVKKINKERWDVLKRILYMQKLLDKNSLENSKNEKVELNSNAIDLQSSSNNIPEPRIASKNVDNNGDYNATPNNTDGNSPKFEYLALKLSDKEISDTFENSLPKTTSSFIDPFAFEDPLDIDFYEGLWAPQAFSNTLLYESVFHCQPTNSVQSWSDYKEFELLKNAFMVNQKIERGYYMKRETFKGRRTNSGSSKSSSTVQVDSSRSSNAKDSTRADVDATAAAAVPGVDNLEENVPESEVDGEMRLYDEYRLNVRRSKMNQIERYTKNGYSVGNMTVYGGTLLNGGFKSKNVNGGGGGTHYTRGVNYENIGVGESGANYGGSGSQASNENINDDIEDFEPQNFNGIPPVFDYGTAEKFLKHIRGNIVQFPVDWLRKELESSNWFYKMDRLPPIEIYD